MHLFARLFGKTEPRQDSDLAARLGALEKRWESIEHEWTDWYDKFRRLHARLAKRQQREDTEEEGGNGAEAPQQSTNPLAQRLLRGPYDGVLPPR